MLANILTQRLPQPFQQTSKPKQEQKAATNIAKLFQKKEEKK